MSDLDGLDAFLLGLLECFTVGLADRHPFDLIGCFLVILYTVGSAEGDLVGFACLGVGESVGERIGVGTAVRAVTGQVDRVLGAL